MDIPVFWIGFFLCFIIITAAGQHLYPLGKVLELLGKRFKRSKDLFNNIVGKYSTFLQLFFKAKGIQAQRDLPDLRRRCESSSGKDDAQAQIVLGAQLLAFLFGDAYAFTGIRIIAVLRHHQRTDCAVGDSSDTAVNVGPEIDVIPEGDTQMADNTRKKLPVLPFGSVGAGGSIRPRGAASGLRGKRPHKLVQLIGCIRRIHCLRKIPYIPQQKTPVPRKAAAVQGSRRMRIGWRESKSEHTVRSIISGCGGISRNVGSGKPILSIFIV